MKYSYHHHIEKRIICVRFVYVMYEINMQDNINPSLVNMKTTQNNNREVKFLKIK